MIFLDKILNFFKKRKYVYGILGILVVGIGGYFLFFRHSPIYQFVTVGRSSITESVSLTGNTTPNQSVVLTFGSSGIVSHTYSNLGKQVYAGQVLAELNTSDLVAQLHNAQAGLVIAKQNTSTSKNNLANVIAQQDILVKNAHANLLNSTFSANQISSSNNSLASPSITGAYTKDMEGTITFTVNQAGSSSGYIVFSGIAEGIAIASTTVPQAIGDTGLYIEFSSTSSYVGTNWTINIPNKTAPDYLANYNAYQLALQTRDKAIADAQANNIESANSSSIVNAQVIQAQASVDSIIAKIENAKIIAPISGTVTQFDAKVGQLASPNVPLISIMSSNGYEVDAGVSEIDIGKISVNDAVTMTLDAFPNETFVGSVFYIAPAETNTQGVINYQVKISFNKQDPRLKSGLTANINIETNHKDNVLILPQYAILQNDQGTFVETLENKKIKQNPVTLGITDQKGNVEVVSGVTEGELVLNIGLKVQ